MLRIKSISHSMAFLISALLKVSTLIGASKLPLRMDTSLGTSSAISFPASIPISMISAPLWRYRLATSMIFSSERRGASAISPMTLGGKSLPAATAALPFPIKKLWGSESFSLATSSAILSCFSIEALISEFRSSHAGFSFESSILSRLSSTRGMSAAYFDPLKVGNPSSSSTLSKSDLTSPGTRIIERSFNLIFFNSFIRSSEVMNDATEMGRTFTSEARELSAAYLRTSFSASSAVTNNIFLPIGITQRTLFRVFGIFFGLLSTT
ncbi:hypothetical protein ES703_00283 [subsurface metagenome]